MRFPAKKVVTLQARITKRKKIMATLVLQIPDESLVQKVKQACKMLVGVTSVKVLKDTKPKEYDITKTAGYREAMDDVKNGRVCHHDSVDDMFKSILGEEAFNEIRSSWWNDKKLSIPQKCVEKSKWK